MAHSKAAFSAFSKEYEYTVFGVSVHFVYMYRWIKDASKDAVSRYFHTSGACTINLALKQSYKA